MYFRLDKFFKKPAYTHAQAGLVKPLNNKLIIIMELAGRGGQPFRLDLTHPKAYIHIPAES